MSRSKNNKGLRQGLAKRRRERVSHALVTSTPCRFCGAESPAHEAGTSMLIACAECGTLLSLPRETPTPASTPDRTYEGHRRQALRPRPRGFTERDLLLLIMAGLVVTILGAALVLVAF